jgi:hypothetical protein
VRKHVADGLRRIGIDVTTTTDARLVGASDVQQLAYAIANGRVVFTEDRDFLALAASSHLRRERGVHPQAKLLGQKQFPFQSLVRLAVLVR